MRAVMPVIPPGLLQWRKTTGAEQWDEMWQGVLHMAPAPNFFHQQLESDIESWLRQFWAKPLGCKVYHQINIAMPGGWPNDYRIPDLILLKPDRFHINRNEYFEGPPTVVVEIHSPGDEAYEKLEFYARLRVPEVWIIHRDARTPEVFTLTADQSQLRYTVTPPDEQGWLISQATQVRLKGASGHRLLMQLADNDSTRGELPDE